MTLGPIRFGDSCDCPCGTGACVACPGGTLPLTFHVLLHGPACLEGVTAAVAYDFPGQWTSHAGTVVLSCSDDSCTVTAIVQCSGPGTLTATVTVASTANPACYVQATLVLRTPGLGDLDCSGPTGHSTAAAFVDRSSGGCGTCTLFVPNACPCPLIGQNVSCELLP